MEMFKRMFKRKKGNNRSRKNAETSAWKSLDEMTGLLSVKKTIRTIVDISVKQKRSSLVMPSLCFVGNPGTGKTTTAKIVAEIFKEEGLIKGQFIFITAKELRGPYVGSTIALTNGVCENARGGVLFINEIHVFIDNDAFGHEAMAELIPWLSDKEWQKETVVILAGCPAEIDKLFETNPVLKDWFSDDHFLTFENYTANELLQIFQHNAEKKQLTVSAEALDALAKIFKKSVQTNSSNDSWGNAREAQILFENVSSSLMKRDSKQIEVCDIPEEFLNIIDKTNLEVNHLPEETQENIPVVNETESEIKNNISIIDQLNQLNSKISTLETSVNAVREDFGNILQNQIILNADIQKAIQNDKQLNEIVHIQSEILSAIRGNVHQDEVIRNQNELQSDLYKKIQLPLIEDIIKIADFSRMTLEHVNEIDESKKLNYLINELGAYIVSVEGVLENNLVTAFSDFKDGKDKLNLDRQKPVDFEYTDEKENDHLVIKSIHPGYLWLLPSNSDTTEKRIVIRPEIVKIYKYKENNNFEYKQLKTK